MTLSDAVTLYETLKKEFASPSADLKKCGDYLNQLKVRKSLFSGHFIIRIWWGISNIWY
jgi:hypothetical protein